MTVTLLMLFFGLVSFASSAQESEYATNGSRVRPSDWYRLTGPQV
jgi:hypothetical protein